MEQRAIARQALAFIGVYTVREKSHSGLKADVMTDTRDNKERESWGRDGKNDSGIASQ